MAVRYFLRVGDGVFRRIGVDRFSAFVEGRAALDADPTEGHVKVAEVVVPTRGRRVIGPPTRITTWRIKVLANGRVDPEHIEHEKAHAFAVTFGARSNDGSLVHAEHRFHERSARWQLSAADRKALLVLAAK